jgi:membrane protein
LFPFFIVAAALAQLIGQTENGALTVGTVLSQLPPEVASTLRQPIREVLTVRTGRCCGSALSSGCGLRQA